MSDRDRTILYKLLRRYGREELADSLDQLCTHDPPSPMTAEADHFPWASGPLFEQGAPDDCR